MFKNTWRRGLERIYSVITCVDPPETLLPHSCTTSSASAEDRGDCPGGTADGDEDHRSTENGAECLPAVVLRQLDDDHGREHDSGGDGHPAGRDVADVHHLDDEERRNHDRGGSETDHVEDDVDDRHVAGNAAGCAGIAGCAGTSHGWSSNGTLVLCAVHTLVMLE